MSNIDDVDAEKDKSGGNRNDPDTMDARFAGYVIIYVLRT